MLETFLMLLARLTGGRLTEVFWGIGYDGWAKLCSWDHPLITFIDDDDPPGPQHLDVTFRVWSKGGHSSTLLSLTGSRMKENMRIEGFDRKRSWTLEPSGKPIDLELRLYPTPLGTPVPYKPGDTLSLDLVVSRGWTKKVNLPIVAGSEP
jgi:hypothetical protein